MNFTFDTQQVFRELAGKGGFSDAQADILINVLRDVVAFNVESLATKDDVKLLRTEMKAMEEQLRVELKLSEERLKSEIDTMQQKLTIRLGGIMVVGIGVLTAIMQLLG